MLAIYDSYLSHERPKTRPKVELLAQKGAFSRFYSLVKAKSRVGKAIELIEAVIGKITGKSSNPSPAAQSSTTNRENRNINRRGFRP